MSKPNSRSKPPAYVVMKNYHEEGWKVECEVDNFQQAYGAREECLRSQCGGEVVIFKRVEFGVQEILVVEGKR